MSARKPTRSIPRKVTSLPLLVVEEDRVASKDADIERFIRTTERPSSCEKRVEGVPPVDRWNHVAMVWRAPEWRIPIVHWKFCVHDCTIGGWSTAVIPIIAWLCMKPKKSKVLNPRWVATLVYPRMERIMLPTRPKPVMTARAQPTPA